MNSQRIRCAECVNKRLLMGNENDCVCGVSSIVEPLYEHHVCSDFEKIKSGEPIKTKRRRKI